MQNSWGGQQRRVLAIKGKTPGSKPGTFLWVGLFLPLASSKVYERQSPGDSSELPGYLDSSLPPETTIYYLRTLPDFFPTPLKDALFHSEPLP